MKIHEQPTQKNTKTAIKLQTKPQRQNMQKKRKPEHHHPQKKLPRQTDHLFFGSQTY